MSDQFKSAKLGSQAISSGKLVLIAFDPLCRKGGESIFLPVSGTSLFNQFPPNGGFTARKTQCSAQVGPLRPDSA